jgi:porin
VVAVSGAPMPIRDFEAAVELTYQWQIRKDWSVQPNVQYIIHPGGHVANPSSLNGAPIPNATVLGVRTMLRF